MSMKPTVRGPSEPGLTPDERSAPETCYVSYARGRGQLFVFPFTAQSASRSVHRNLRWCPLLDDWRSRIADRDDDVPSPTRASKHSKIRDPVAIVVPGALEYFRECHVAG